MEGRQHTVSLDRDLRSVGRGPHSELAGRRKDIGSKGQRTGEEGSLHCDDLIKSKTGDREDSVLKWQ